MRRRGLTHTFLLSVYLNAQPLSQRLRYWIDYLGNLSQLLSALFIGTCRNLQDLTRPDVPYVVLRLELNVV